MLKANPALRLERDASKFLPYARHVNEHMLALDNGEYMAVFRLDGIAFETADVATINDWHEKLNGAWRVIAHDRIALMTHTVRRIERNYLDGQFRSAFAAHLDDCYRARVLARRMFVNELYLTVLYRPAVGAADNYLFETGWGTSRSRLVGGTWSPDGTQIAFTSTRSGNSDVWLMNPDGTGVKRLTTSTGSEMPLSVALRGSDVRCESPTVATQIGRAHV